MEQTQNVGGGYKSHYQTQKKNTSSQKQRPSQLLPDQTSHMGALITRTQQPHPNQPKTSQQVLTQNNDAHSFKQGNTQKLLKAAQMENINSLIFVPNK